VAPPKNDQYALNGAQGNLIGEIFQQPPRSSGKKEVGEGQGMKNLQENFIGLFLGFVGIGAQGQKQLGKHPVIIRHRPNRRQNRAIGLEVSNVVEGALNFRENAGRNVAQIIVSKSIEGTKEPRGDGRSVPTGRSKERRIRGVSRNIVKGVKESTPPFTPALKRHSRGPKHGSTVNGNDGPNRKKAVLLKLKRAMNAICIVRDSKDFGNGSGLEL